MMRKNVLVYLSVLILGLNMTAFAQSTAFTYQGALTTSGTPASGSHDFEFAMFNGGGVQIGSTLTLLNIPVTNGTFTVQLDFGNQFQGADRFLEIRVRTAGGGAFTTLTPRQLITSAPHAIKSLNADTASNALQLAGVPAASYIVSGSAIIDAGSQFNIGTRHALSTVNNTLGTFVGIDAGRFNTGNLNSFFGHQAGKSNTTGMANSFFGTGVGQNNTTGSSNSFFGVGAGDLNTTGSENSLFGTQAGASSQTASRNSLFGVQAGINNVGNDNSFFGRRSGFANTTGTSNVFLGHSAGLANTTGSTNTFIGTFAGAANTTADFNTFVGTDAGRNNTAASNAFFGWSAGAANTIGTNNAYFGASSGRVSTGSANAFFGSFAGTDNTTGSGNSFLGASSGFNNTTGADNTFAGSKSGRLNTTASDNSFFGSRSGEQNTTGSSNTFMGAGSGTLNTVGTGNTFAGTAAGGANSTASNNTFIGRSAGAQNTIGASNSFLGASSGLFNTTGQNNAFFGTNSGLDNTTGSSNSFFGATAGDNNTTGSFNSVFGFGAATTNTIGTENSYFGANSNSSDGLTNATAIGSRAFVTSNNSIVLGSINGVNGATVNARVGIGTTAPLNRLTIGEPETPLLTGSVGVFNAGGTFLTVRDTTNDIEGFIGADTNGVLFGSISSSPVRIRTNNTTRLTIDAGGNAIFSGIANFSSFAVVDTLDTGGATPLCRNASNRISTCSSSLRYKSNINLFRPGLELIKRLNPITFDWKDGGMHDLGLGAEDVAKVEPLLVTYNKQGEAEGVKYDRVGVVLVNAVKEQQQLIDSQQKEIEILRAQMTAMKKLLCASNPTADLCKETK